MWSTFDRDSYLVGILVGIVCMTVSRVAFILWDARKVAK